MLLSNLMLSVFYILYIHPGIVLRQYFDLGWKILFTFYTNSKIALDQNFDRVEKKSTGDLMFIKALSVLVRQ